MIVSEGMIGCCCEFAGAIGREEEPKFAVMTSGVWSESIECECLFRLSRPFEGLR